MGITFCDDHQRAGIIQCCVHLQDAVHARATIPPFVTFRATYVDVTFEQYVCSECAAGLGHEQDVTYPGDVTLEEGEKLYAAIDIKFVCGKCWLELASK